MTGGLGSIEARAVCSLLTTSSWMSERPGKEVLRDVDGENNLGFVEPWANHVISTCSFQAHPRKS